MSFEDFVQEIQNGKTVEEIAKNLNVTELECDGNIVYEDDDLATFLDSMGAYIEDMNVGYAVISTNTDKHYEVPYEERPNRFNSDLPNETVLFFKPDTLYDVTSDRTSIEEN